MDLCNPLASVDERRERDENGVCPSRLHHRLASFPDDVDDRVGHGVGAAAAADVEVGLVLSQQISALMIGSGHEQGGG